MKITEKIAKASGDIFLTIIMVLTTISVMQFLAQRTDFEAWFYTTCFCITGVFWLSDVVKLFKKEK